MELSNRFDILLRNGQRERCGCKKAGKRMGTEGNRLKIDQIHQKPL